MTATEAPIRRGALEAAWQYHDDQLARFGRCGGPGDWYAHLARDAALASGALEAESIDHHDGGLVAPILQAFVLLGCSGAIVGLIFGLVLGWLVWGRS